MKDLKSKCCQTRDGWCCACDYDMAVLKDKISKAVAEERERIVKGVEKIGTVELLGIKEMIKVEDVINVINNLEK